MIKKIEKTYYIESSLESQNTDEKLRETVPLLGIRDVEMCSVTLYGVCKNMRYGRVFRDLDHILISHNMLHHHIIGHFYNHLKYPDIDISIHLILFIHFWKKSHVAQPGLELPM